jgi:hypothetical protein
MNGVEYNRPARVYPGQLPSGEITMIAPPTIPQWPKGVAAWLPFLMPVIGSLGAIGFVFIYHNIWMMVFGIGFAVCSILSGVLMWWGQRRTVKLQYKSNHEKYTKYLEMQAEKLQEITDKQRAFQDVLFPDVGQLVEFAKTRQRVWERRRTDADFLHVSMARGPVKLCCPIRFDAASNLMLDFDPLLLEQASALVEAYEHVDDAPISLSLPSVGSLTVTGDIEEVRALVRSILTQVAVLYAPNDVQLMTYCEGNTVEHWSWMKWLPHCRWGNGLKATSGGTSLCYLADNPVDFAAMFEEQMLPRLKRIRSGRWRHGATRADCRGDRFGEKRTVADHGDGDGADACAGRAQLRLRGLQRRGRLCGSCHAAAQCGDCHKSRARLDARR